MDTAYNYGNAILPHKFTICGVELQPFCIGHLIILEQLNNPLISPTEQPVDIKQGIIFLYEALLVCAMSYEDNLRVLYNDKEYQELADAFIQNVKANMDMEPNWNIPSKLNMFKQYIKHHMEMPVYNEENPSNDTPSGSDWKSSMIVIFKKLGYSEPEILNMSIKKMFFEWCSYAESEGAIKVWNKHDVDMLESMKRDREMKELESIIKE